MQGFLKKGYDLSYGHSMALGISDGHSWWPSMDSQEQQSTVSRNLSFKMASPMDCFQSAKQLHLQFQDQESSSTQSTGQSCPGEGSLETKGCGKSAMPIQPRFGGAHVKSEEDQSKSTISFQDNGLSFSSIDYRQYASVPCAYPDPYHRGLFAGCGPYPVVPSQMMGMALTRVPLPPDAALDEPIYVNAKQIRAILRRRESRAKLEAQNKLPKVRKPYLHESRHLHAVKRARGSGGRFLNTKKLQESKATVKTSGQDMSNPFQLQLQMPTAGPEVHHIENHNEGISRACCLDMTQNHNEEISKTTCSDITDASNSENTFHLQDFRFAIYRPQNVGRIENTQQFLSVLQ